MPTRIVCLGMLMAALFTACQSSKEDKTSGPQVKIVSPSNNSMFNANDNVRIQANMSDDDGLHAYTVMLKNTTANTTVLSYQKYQHGLTFVVDTTVNLNVSNHADFVLTVTAENHEGQSATQLVGFHVMP